MQKFVGKEGGANSILYFGQKTTANLGIKLLFGKNGYEVSLIPSSGDELIFEREACWYHEPQYKKPYTVELGSGHSETNLPEEAAKDAGRIARYVQSAIKSWRVYHFHDTSESSAMKKTANIDDNAFFRPDASNLASFLYLLKETENEYYQRIRNTIQLVAPFFEDFVLIPSRLNKEKIRLEWKEFGSTTYFNANNLSDGTLRFICLSTLLLQPNLPTTILIDEPELGLHPYAITLLASLIKSAANQTQLIVSTQSVPLVNQFSPEQIIVVDRDHNQSTFRRLDSKHIASWLDDYGLGDLWEKNIIGGRPS